MADQTLVDNIRKENFTLQIFQAFNNNPLIPKLVSRLTKTIQDIYRYLEPSHFDGCLIVYTLLDGPNILNENDSINVYAKNILINNSSHTLVLQLTDDDRLLMWENVKVDDIYQNDNAIFYCFANKSEYFYAKGTQIDIVNNFSCPSIFALQYHALQEALYRYKNEKIRHSSCEHFRECWHDDNRIFFKNGPEGTMQISLKEFLNSSLRGVDVVREYTLGASKPVDIRVHWKEANRSALIELKWLGKSKHSNDELSTTYTNVRAIEGIDQLKKYLDLASQDTPTCITKGYLAVIDGRRSRTNKDTTIIDSTNGLYYEDKELEIDEAKKYFNTMKNYEKPIRMFVEPICH